MKKLFFFITALSALSVCVNGQNSSPYWSLAGNSNATSSSKLGTTNAINLRIFTNNLERARVTTSGLVGIGTTAPNSRLHVNSTAGQNPFRAQVNGSTKFFVDDLGGVTVGSSTTPPANGLYVSGRVGIGTATPSYKLHVHTSGVAVYGNSTGTSGYGVWGNSAYLGVYGSGTSYGVFGSGNYGVYGSGSTYGVYGSGAYGVYGSGSSYGVYGYSSSNYGLYGQSGSVGVYGTATNYGVSGQGGTYGVSGNGSYIGVFGSSSSNAVVGNASGSGTGGNFYSDNATGLIAGTKRTDKNWAAIFNGNTYAYGSYLPSDRNLKNNIQNFEDALKIISQLKPKTYEYKKEGNFEKMHLPSGKHYGLVAQEVEEILPGLIKEVDFQGPVLGEIPLDSVGSNVKPAATISDVKEKITTKAINYIELISIVIKGMQEQQNQITELKQDNDELRSQINELKSLIPGTKNHTSLSGYLKQNSPNPFNTSTVISYYVPDNAGYAQVKITDAKGRVIKTFNAAEGEGHINIRSSELPAGTYNYTLYLNNKTADTKQMVLLK